MQGFVSQVKRAIPTCAHFEFGSSASRVRGRMLPRCLNNLLQNGLPPIGPEALCPIAPRPLRVDSEWAHKMVLDPLDRVSMHPPHSHSSRATKLDINPRLPASKLFKNHFWLHGKQHDPGALGQILLPRELQLQQTVLAGQVSP